MLPTLTAHPVIEFTFNPIVTIAGFNVRLETIGIAVAILLGLVAAAFFARATPVDTSRPASAQDEEGERNHLRRDDLLYISVAAFPGAVIGGRIGYALLHLDFYQGSGAALLDIGQGGFQLSLGVVGGFLTAGFVAAMLGAPLGRWMHASILPLLLVLGVGKLALVLGGTGQGQLFDGTWATAYTSPGPWGSLAPELPAHPSQMYEALGTGIALLVTMWMMVWGLFDRRSGGAFLLGLGLWAVVRLVVATTWRDPVVTADLRMDQLISIGIAVVSFVLLAIVSTAGSARARREKTASAAVDPGPDWPDAATRPGI